MRRETARLIVLVGLVAAPAAMACAALGYPYGVAGAVVFAVMALASARIWRSRWVPCVLASALVGISVTVGLHWASRHSVVLENRSGQRIMEIAIGLEGSDKVMALRRVPRDAVLQLTFHELIYRGGPYVEFGTLEDGTKIPSWTTPPTSGEYRRKARIVVERGGVVRVANGGSRRERSGVLRDSCPFGCYLAIERCRSLIRLDQCRF
jgi:hypothetical protein